MLKQRRSYLAIVLILLLVNIILIWYYSNLTKNLENNNESISVIDLTIIICSFEEFENDIAVTAQHISSVYPNIQILIFSESQPYPYISIVGANAKIVTTEKDFTSPTFLNDPLRFILTEFVLILPDSSRIRDSNSLNQLLSEYKSRPFNSVLAVPIMDSIKRCKKIEFDRKLWSLKYFSHSDINRCEAFTDQVALIMRTSVLRHLPSPFMKPFEESVYLQCKLLNISIDVFNADLFYLGKILFTSNHNKWKHENNINLARRDLYKQLGVKYHVDDSGRESFYGCNKNTQRCFPSIIDIPKYLYERKWTPPCCLKALRETARHVFKVLDRYRIRYWLEGGSLLGAARSNDIIPWDYDVDIGMYLNDISKYKLLNDVWGGKVITDDEGYVWQRLKEHDQVSIQYSSVNHLHVDIFPFYEKNGMMTKDTWYKSHRQDMEFPQHYLKPLQEMMFVGVAVSVPNNHRHFLELKFGKGVIENPQYPFPKKLRNIRN